MDIEMQNIRTNGENGAAYVNGSTDRVTPGNGESVALDAKETDVLLSVQVDGCNGGRKPSDHAAEPQGNQGHALGEGCNGEVITCSDDSESQRNPGNASREIRSIKKELNEFIFWKVKLWMAIIFIILLILAVIISSLLLCSVIHEDVDEKFDPSLFKFPLYFNGSFQLPNQVFKEELFTLSFNESQTLAADLQQKLADLYRSSPALGRYFSGAEIYAFRNGSVIADYQLKFLMPEEQQDPLRNFILSREMVYNVFRQFLYDQESDESGPMYIDPVSLIMFLRQ
ncbi:TPA-induced transmembrane protein homolog [Labrus mixtus]|uniref:TPA-induced transmembrane protein homolog n=1 Tax=Labrus mixtus TaxID=508554 RepID=UPI0029C0095B|nr:TPA-induced transmembrane protein homolog [Labrus mixtus]